MTRACSHPRSATLVPLRDPHLWLPSAICLLSILLRPMQPISLRIPSVSLFASSQTCTYACVLCSTRFAATAVAIRNVPSSSLALPCTSVVWLFSTRSLEVQYPTPKCFVRYCVATHRPYRVSSHPGLLGMSGSTIMTTSFL